MADTGYTPEAPNTVLLHRVDQHARGANFLTLDAFPQVMAAGVLTLALGLGVDIAVFSRSLSAWSPDAGGTRTG